MHSFVRAAADSAAARAVLSVRPDGGSARILVALSGGPDSCALLLALSEAADAGVLPRPVGAAHFHHGLRPDDADQDAAFSAALATARLGLPCAIGLGAVRPGGRSPNEAARHDRYAFLIETARAWDADVLVTAHTADDQAETVLLRVLRGASVDGLAGVPAVRELAPGLLLARPLLDLRRADVEAYCAERGVSPRRDPSNEKDRYARARLRRRLPELARDFNPQLTDALTRLAGHASADADLLSSLADALWTRAARRCWPGLSVHLEGQPLAEAHPALRRRILLRAVHAAYGTPDDAADGREEGATAAFVALLEQSVQAGAGAHDLPGGVRAQVSGGLLALERRPKTGAGDDPLPYRVPLGVPGRVFVEEAGVWVDGTLSPPSGEVRTLADAGPYSVSLDADACGTMATDRADAPPSLIVRSAKSGDRIAPLGMKGKTRLVRDVMADAGWPEPLRARAPLVVRADDDRVLWVVGLAQSETTRVREDTRSVVRLGARFAC